MRIIGCMISRGVELNVIWAYYQIDHVSDCESQVQLPNAIAVDFYEQDGNPSDGVHSVVRAADYLNGV
jgi:hypothetical protein